MEVISNEKSFRDKAKFYLIRFAGFLGFLVVVVPPFLANSSSNILAFLKISPDDYNKAYLFVFIFCSVILIINIALWVIIFSEKRKEEIIQAIEKKQKICLDFQETFLPLKQIVSDAVKNNELNNSVLNGSEVDKLEASVRKDNRIMIFTSKFILEGTRKFPNIIICNFRKGVKYVYYIPDDKPVAQENYKARVIQWYNEFSSFTKNKEVAEELKKLAEEDKESENEWNSEYYKLILNYLAIPSKQGKQRDIAISGIEGELRKLFFSQLTTYTLDINLFFVTVAMYELENKWDPIIKLPTENQDENYMAFSLKYADTYERGEFIHSILRLKETAKELNIQEEIFRN